MESVQTILKREVSLGAKGSEFDSCVEDGLADLAQRAADVFGYTRLKLTHGENSDAMELRRCMTELNIVPFDRNTVDKYKDRMVADIRNNSTAHTVLRILRTALFSVLAISPILSLSLSNPHFLLLLVFIIPLGIGMGVADDSCPNGVWRRYDLNSSYFSPIPEFALETALRLNEKCPKANFFIDELGLQKKVLGRSLDPFLVVNLGGSEGFYIEVWNEPKFTRI